MIWLIIGYMILFIHRPFEIWPWLGDMRLERVYAIVMICALPISGRVSFRNNATNWAVALFAFVIVASYLLSPWTATQSADKTVVGWFKQLTLFIVIVLSVREERDLRLLFLGFAVALALFVGHSVWEYFMGRYTWRGTTVRIAGVNKTFAHVNSFSMLALLGLMMAPLLWRQYPQKWIRISTIGYAVVATYAILFLAGSRTGFVGLVFVLGSIALRSGRVIQFALIACCIAPIVWSQVPEDKRDWLNTAWTREDGSAQLRSEDFHNGLELFSRYPLLGAGPGAWQSATGRVLVSHNLYGQILGELGLAGIIAFTLLIYTILKNAWFALKSDMLHPDSEFIHSVASTLIWATLLLLLLGMAGGSLFQFTWLYLAAFSVVTAYRVEDMQHDLDDLELSDGDVAGVEGIETAGFHMNTLQLAGSEGDHVATH